LITKATEFVDEYDEKGKLVRWAARNQLGDEMDNLNQELNAFGDRFRVRTGYLEISSALTWIVDPSLGRSYDKSEREHSNHDPHP
jgi:hypothetical protein